MNTNPNQTPTIVFDIVSMDGFKTQDKSEV